MTIWILLNCVCSCSYQSCSASSWVPSPAKRTTPTENMDLERKNADRAEEAKGTKPLPPLPQRWASEELPKYSVRILTSSATAKGTDSLGPAPS